MNSRNFRYKKTSKALTKLAVVSVIAFIIAIIAFIVVSMYYGFDGNTVENKDIRKADKTEKIMDVKVVEQNDDIACFDKKLPRGLDGKKSAHCIAKGDYKSSEFKEGNEFELVKLQGKNPNGQEYKAYTFARK